MDKSHQDTTNGLATQEKVEQQAMVDTKTQELVAVKGQGAANASLPSQQQDMDAATPTTLAAIHPLDHRNMHDHGRRLFMNIFIYMYIYVYTI